MKPNKLNLCCTYGVYYTRNFLNTSRFDKPFYHISLNYPEKHSFNINITPLLTGRRTRPKHG